ncbi:NUDIX domain-containing protein [Streptomyces sp. NPDC001502]|uniref:NUDIX domain-containing protein n=1 Tax=Streptomyces sp. NPDC001502 TaxID=3364578 RepID=UPI003685668F
MTGIVIEDGQILLLDQDTDGDRSWSLPGGKVEPGETLEEALKREMLEETGAEVEVGRLLYVCDHTAAHVGCRTGSGGNLHADGCERQLAGKTLRPARGVEPSSLQAHRYEVGWFAVNFGRSRKGSLMVSR